MEGLHVSIAICAGMQLSEMVSLRRLEFTGMAVNAGVVPSTFLHDKQGEYIESEVTFEISCWGNVFLLFFFLV